MAATCKTSDRSTIQRRERHVLGVLTPLVGLLLVELNSAASGRALLGRVGFHSRLAVEIAGFGERIAAGEASRSPSSRPNSGFSSLLRRDSFAEAGYLNG